MENLCSFFPIILIFLALNEMAIGMQLLNFLIYYITEGLNKIGLKPDQITDTYIAQHMGRF